jgi:hypothetical protein
MGIVRCVAKHQTVLAPAEYQRSLLEMIERITSPIDATFNPPEVPPCADSRT